jgi:tetratricopeptide (TPR) repeat protein
MMPAIYDEVRVVLWIITGIASAIVVVFSYLLEPNIRYWIRRHLPGEIRKGKGPTKRPRITWVIYLSAISVFIIGTSIASSAPRKVELVPMVGDFRVAIAGFDIVGDIQNKKLGQELAQGVKLRLDQDLKEINPNLIMTIWGPEQVGDIKGKDQDSRAQNAAKLANDINADMVIYGFVDVNQLLWQVVPEFYLKDTSFIQAEEIVGQYEFGSPIAMPGNDNITGRVELGEQMTVRSKVLSRIAIGLAYFAIHNYDKSMNYLESTENIPEWTDDQSKKVVYLLIGNAAGKANQIAKAEEYFRESLIKDPNYARAYVGLGSVAYSQALAPYNVSKNPKDIDLANLEQAITQYHKALQSTDKPPLSDIEIKVHFGLGQCYILLVLSGNEKTFDLAVEEFNQVIKGYNNGENPRVQELASEAHARLGLIYRLSGFSDKALDEYKIALSLAEEYSERWNIYQSEISTLQPLISTPTKWNKEKGEVPTSTR